MMEIGMNHRVNIVCAIALAFVLLGCSSEEETTRRHAVPKPAVVDGIKDAGETGKGVPGEESPAVFGTVEDTAESDLTDILRVAKKKKGYSSEGKIDPFKSLYAENENKDPGFVDPRGKEKPPLSPVNDCGVTPLTQVGLEQLKLVAILKGVSGAYALVEDASGEGICSQRPGVHRHPFGTGGRHPVGRGGHPGAVPGPGACGWRLAASRDPDPGAKTDVSAQKRRLISRRVDDRLIAGR